MADYQSRIRRTFEVTNRFFVDLWKDPEAGIPTKVACTLHYPALLATCYVMEGYRRNVTR